MRIGILQPGYLPWLGFFEQVHRCDRFVIYDDVQFDKNGWRNRNRIKTSQGPQWLTVPVHSPLGESINRTAIDNSEQWARKHLTALRMNYARAPFFDHYIPLFEEAYSRTWELLVDLDMHFIYLLAGILGIDTQKIVRSSGLSVSGDRIERLLGICTYFKADIFYEGQAGKSYIDEKYFAQRGVTVEFQEYVHPVYAQLWGDFVPYLSVIDLIFNHGSRSLEILTSPQPLQ